MTLTALLIDGDAAFSAQLKTALEAQGFSVDLAADCAAGLAKAKAVPPSVIVLDMIFAGKADGIIAARKLKRSQPYASLAKTPVLMLSSLKTQANLQFPKTSKYPYRLPVSEFMEKPAAPEAVALKAKELAAR